MPRLWRQRRGRKQALLPERSIDEELRTGTLHVLKTPELRFTIPVVLVHRRRAYLSGAARQLLAVLKEE